MTTRLRRTAASEYLKNHWGISRTPGTLAKLAVKGGGPRFQCIGRTPLYPIYELDKWAEENLSQLMRSTSEKSTVESLAAYSDDLPF